MIVIYTDGSTRRNGSQDAKGGFGVVVCEVHKEEKPEQYTVIKTYQEFSQKITTNNREEMRAIIWVLENYGSITPVVYTDSMYCVNTFTKWMKMWKSNCWVKNDRKIPENLDLIKKYDKLLESGYRIDLRYVKGHSGIIWNEIADQLATGKISSYNGV